MYKAIQSKSKQREANEAMSERPQVHAAAVWQLLRILTFFGRVVVRLLLELCHDLRTVQVPAHQMCM